MARVAALFKGPSTVRGMGFMALSALFNALSAVLIRHTGEALHPFEVAFLANLLALVILFPILARRRFAPLTSGNHRLQLLRGAITFGAMLAWYLGLTLMPLAQATALNFSGPLFGAVLAVAVLGERIRAPRIAALVIGYLGALVVLRPGFVEIGLGPLLILAASAVYGVIIVMLRVLARTDSSLTSTVYTYLCVTPFTFLAALPVWQGPSGAELFWITCLALATMLHFWTLAQAFAEAEPTAAVPFDFTRLLWAAGFGYLLWGEVPDIWTWVGGVMIFGAAFFIMLRERRARAERAGALES